VSTSVRAAPAMLTPKFPDHSRGPPRIQL
jgi:hypothetical protein